MTGGTALLNEENQINIETQANASAWMKNEDSSSLYVCRLSTGNIAHFSLMRLLIPKLLCFSRHNLKGLPELHNILFLQPGIVYHPLSVCIMQTGICASKPRSVIHSFRTTIQFPLKNYLLPPCTPLETYESVSCGTCPVFILILSVAGSQSTLKLLYSSLCLQHCT